MNTHKKQNEVTRWTSAKEKKTGNKTKNKTKQNERTKNNQNKINKLTDKKEGRKNGKESQEDLTQVRKKIQKQKKKRNIVENLKNHKQTDQKNTTTITYTEKSCQCPCSVVRKWFESSLCQEYASGKEF